MPQIAALFKGYGEDLGCAVIISGPPGMKYDRLKQKLKKVKPKKYALLRDRIRDYAGSLMARYHAPSGQWFVIDPQGVIQAQGDDLDKAAHALSEASGKPVVKLPPLDRLGDMFMGGGMAPPEAAREQEPPTGKEAAPKKGTHDRTPSSGAASTGDAQKKDGGDAANGQEEKQRE